MSGILVISLDFELHWGAFEKRPISLWHEHYCRTRALIPGLLEVFNANTIAATWATVGLLMHATREELLEDYPDAEPTYDDPALSPYAYIRQNGIGENERQDPCHFAAELVHRIMDTPGQEIGTHTFGHYYCNEPGQTLAQFRADLHSACKAAQRMGIELKSLVFPRNQFNDAYLEVCREHGIVAVRTNPDVWFWRITTRDESLYKRIWRGSDAYWPLRSMRNSNRYFPKDLYTKDMPLSIPASRVLRPYHPKESFLNTWKLKRILGEMEAAAREDSIYHLWWHPHNFAHHPEENLQLTSDICRHARHLGLQSLSMGELADMIRTQYAN